jgi:hypothetical protein
MTAQQQTDLISRITSKYKQLWGSDLTDTDVQSLFEVVAPTLGVADTDIYPPVTTVSDIPVVTLTPNNDGGGSLVWELTGTNKLKIDQGGTVYTNSEITSNDDGVAFTIKITNSTGNDSQVFHMVID